MILSSVLFFFFLSICLSVFSAYLYKKLKSVEKELEGLTSKNNSFEKELRALLRADIIFGQSLNQLKKHLLALDDKQTMFESRRSNDGGYQHALKLLELGSSIEQIIQDCNLTHAEAELLANLQAYQMAR